MIFNTHSEYQDKHAVLSASKYHWLNYTEERLFDYVDNLSAAALGTKKHEFAKMAIELGEKMPNNQKTLCMYINDCIGFRMKPEVLLFYSKWAFGTTDAISFRREMVDGHEQMVLRIFDLKTGTSKVNGTQLAVYAALFCLEYKVRPFDILFDLRIYQSDDVIEFDVDPEEIVQIMSRITELSKLITERVEQGGVG